MLIPREGSLLLAASGSLRIVCEPIAINLAWNLIFGINHQTIGRVVHLWTRSTDTGSSILVAFSAVFNGNDAEPSSATRPKWTAASPQTT